MAAAREGRVSDDLSDEVLTSEEAAALLKVTRKRLYQLPIPCTKLSIRTRRYLRGDVMDFLRKRRLTAA